MSSLRLLFFVKRRILSSLFFDKRKSSLVRNISTGVVLLLLAYASYRFFHDLIFTYVINLEEIGFLLIDRLVSLGFLGFFFMLIISSFITALVTLFRSTETEYLFSTPLLDIELLTSKFIDIMVYSSWAILFMALPILHAYAQVRKFGTLEYALTGFFALCCYRNSSRYNHSHYDSFEFEIYQHETAYCHWYHAFYRFHISYHQVLSDKPA